MGSRSAEGLPESASAESSASWKGQISESDQRPVQFTTQRFTATKWHQILTRFWQTRKQTRE
eukprot:1949362-Amphidinium_carterae.1